MRRFAAFVIIDITGDPKLPDVADAIEKALRATRIAGDKVTGADVPGLVTVSSKHDIAMPDNLLAMVDFKKGGKPS